MSPRYDPVDLSIRFKDIEWVRPHITYESLTEGGLPVDLYSIKEKCDAYTSVVSSQWSIFAVLDRYQI